MKILHTPASSWSTRYSYLFLYTFLFIIFASSQSSGQSIYDLAIQLDSLYDRIERQDISAVEPFYATIRKVNNRPSNYPVSELLFEIKGIENEFYLVRQLDKRIDNSPAAVRNDLLSKKDSLLEVGVLILQIDDSTKNNEIQEVIKKGGTRTDALEIILEQSGPYPDSTQAKIEAILFQVEQINTKSGELYYGNPSEVNLTQQDEALDMFPLGSESTAPLVPPIIIQNQGGGSAQSAIIDGTAKWIAERMRQELSIAFFDRFETWAENKNISLLFPNTLSVLRSSATTDYTLMMEIYKRAFEKDLKQLTFNIAPFLENEIIEGGKNQQLEHELRQLSYQVMMVKYAGIRDDPESGIAIFSSNRREITALMEANKDSFDYSLTFYSAPSRNIMFYDTLQYLQKGLVNLLEKQRAAKQKELNRFQAIKFLSLSLNTVNMLREGQHPSALIHSLYTQVPQLFPDNDRLEPILLLFSVISQSLTSTNPEQNTVWIGKEALTRLSKDRQLQKFYFGLILTRVQFLMDAKMKKQEYDKYDNLSKPLKDRIRNMKKQEKTLFYTYWEHLFEENDPVFEYDYFQDTTAYSSFLENKIQNFTFQTSSEIDQDKLDEKLSYLNSLLLSSQQPKYLGASTKIFEEDSRRRDAIVNLLRAPIGEEDNYILAAFGLSKKEDNPFMKREKTSIRYPFVDRLYSFITQYDDVEEAKAAYFDEFEFNVIAPDITKLIKPDLDAENTLAVIDSITNMRVKARKANMWLWNYDKDSEKFKFWQQYELQKVIPDSLNILEQFSGNENDFITAKAHEFQIIEQQGLLYQIFEDKNKIGQLFSQFAQYTNKIDQINAQFKSLRSNGQANFGNQEFIYLIKNSMGILDLIFEHTVDKNDQRMVRNMETIQFATNNLFDAYIAGFSEDYNGLVMNIIPVVERLIANKYDKIITPLENKLRPTLSEEKLRMGLLPQSAELDSLRLLRDDKLRKMQEVFKYCTFIAAVAKSNGSDDVKKAINAIALPVGSYSIKRRNYANISLNAYPGITGGFELVQNNNFSEWAPNFGFTAPIGIGINWAYRSKVNERRYLKSAGYRSRIQKTEIGLDDRMFNGHSGSFFFSFVDLGALVLFRLNDSNEPLPEDVGLKQVFSPGVAYVHGLPRVPISVMVGGQITPGLRKVGEGSNAESANSFRFNVSIVVDLPIANFYTRRRPKS